MGVEVGSAGWAPDYRSDGFRDTSHFTSTAAEAEVLKTHADRAALPKALFATTTAGWQGETVEIKTGQLRAWWHDIDDLLSAVTNLGSGRKRSDVQELQAAIGQVEALQHALDDLVRSRNASAVRSDRDPR